MAGIVETTTDTSLTLRNIEGDSILYLTIDEATTFDGGDLIEGNAVEVFYQPSRRGDVLHALEITADETYPEAMGRWVTGPRAELPVDIELLPRGAVSQTSPPSLLRFDSWYVDGETEGKIHITGEAVIAADSIERYPFTVDATLSGDQNGDLLIVEGTSGSKIRLRRVVE